MPTLPAHGLPFDAVLGRQKSDFLPAAKYQPCPEPLEVLKPVGDAHELLVLRVEALDRPVADPPSVDREREGVDYVLPPVGQGLHERGHLGDLNDRRVRPQLVEALYRGLGGAWL